MTYPFKTLIIDPPWPYQKASKSEKMTGFVNQEGNEQYPTLSIADLKALPVGDIVSDYVLMWTVGPFIREGLELFDSWGFLYRSQMVWTKSTGLGVGYWFRGDHELVLVGSRKNSDAIRTNERSVFSAPRTRHSAKPDNLHILVEKHFEGPYLEIFGRAARDGWTVLGNEAPEDGTDIRKSLESYIEKEEFMTEKTCETCNQVYKRDRGFKHRDGLCLGVIEKSVTLAAEPSLTEVDISQYIKLNQKIDSLRIELQRLENLKQQLEAL